MVNNKRNNNNGYEVIGKTRSGLYPTQKEGLLYQITTDDVRSYFEDKAHTIANLTNSKAGTNYRWDINLSTTQSGKYFLPFVMIIPDDAVEENDMYSKTPDIFNPSKDDDTVRLLKPFYRSIIRPYVYDKSDINVFRSSSWKFSSGVKQPMSNKLVSLASPRIVSFNHGKLTKIVVLLDPIRVFYDMLKMDDGRKDYIVKIEKWKKIKMGEYRFDVRRMRDTGHKGDKADYNKQLFSELNYSVMR